MRYSATCMLLVLVGSATLAAAAEPIGVDEIEGPFKWGALANVTRLRHLYFAGQPDRAALEAASRAGVALVINLRAPAEMNWDEKAAVESLGMRYANVPVRGRRLEPDAIERIEAQLAANPGAPTLIHCASSNRVGAWLATHLVTRHEVPLQDALAMGRKAGMTKKRLEARVQRYLERRGSAQGDTNPTAVKGTPP